MIKIIKHYWASINKIGQPVQTNDFVYIIRNKWITNNKSQNTNFKTTFFCKSLQLYFDSMHLTFFLLYKNKNLILYMKFPY